MNDIYNDSMKDTSDQKKPKKQKTPFYTQMYMLSYLK